jgi:hypothetical protein
VFIPPRGNLDAREAGTALAGRGLHTGDLPMIMCEFRRSLPLRLHVPQPLPETVPPPPPTPRPDDIPPEIIEPPTPTEIPPIGEPGAPPPPMPARH